MKESIKISFKDDDTFTIFYLTEKEYLEEADFKELFKTFNIKLISKYDYRFHGFYEVNIYHNKGIYIFDFEFIETYPENDFDVTLVLDSDILYEFEDSDLVDGKKIYYKDKYYVEIGKMIDNIKLFEYGNIIYNEYVNKILKLGIIID